MRKWKIAVLIGVCTLAQVILPGKIPGYHWLRVEWTLLAVIFLSLRRDWHLTMWVGMAGGFAVDLISGGRLGIFALSYLAAAAVLGFYHRWLLQDSLLPICILTFLMSLFVSTVSFFILQFFGNYPGFWSYLWRSMLPAAAVNAIFTAPFFLVVSRLPGRSIYQF